MNQKTKTIIITTIIAIIVIAAFTLSILSQRVILNEGNVTGNTAGNLNNGGLFCEKNGTIYFSNLYDNGCLYSMNADGTDLKKLTASGVSSINADDHYLYYYMDSSKAGTGLGYMQRTYGIYRSRLDGSDSECLKRGNAITLQLCGNYLYYQNFDNDNKNGTELFKIKIDKKEDLRIADYNINPACCLEGNIYFNGMEEDHYLYALNTVNDTISLVWNGGNVWNPVYENGYFYFMDVDNHYRLCRYSPSANVVEILTHDRIDFYNVYGDMIYYQKSSESEPALMRMHTDGSSVETVANGVYKNINITAHYTYFVPYDADTELYRTPTFGGINVTAFDAAMQAALAEQEAVK